MAQNVNTYLVSDSSKITTSPDASIVTLFVFSTGGNLVLAIKDSSGTVKQLKDSTAVACHFL